MKHPLGIRAFATATAVYVLVLAGGLTVAGINSQTTPDVPPSGPGVITDSLSIGVETDSLEELVGDERVLRLALQNELTAPRRLDSLRRRLYETIGSQMERVGFGSIQIELEGSRRKIARQLEQGSIHLAVVPSNVIGRITDSYPSVSDWEYQLLLAHGEYRSAVIFLRDTPIRELRDLRTYTVAAPHERSSSGYQIPTGYLEERGIQPQVRFLDGGHPDVWNAVLKGHVKAGFTYDGFKDELPPAKAGRLNMIEIPIRIPGSVWVLRKDLTEIEGFEAGVKDVIREFIKGNKNPYWSKVTRLDDQALEEYDTYRRIMNEMD